MQYLVISRETDSVIATGSTVPEAVTRALDMGYLSSCYIDNQDGGRAELEDWINQNASRLAAYRGEEELNHPEDYYSDHSPYDIEEDEE